jgi:transcriptional regulator with XRE-family HTH domain
MRLQELGYTIRKARLARGLTQAALAYTVGLSRTTMNQLENGLFPDIGVRKAQAILQALGLELHVRPAQRTRRPDYLRMACVSASASYRESLTEGELVRALLTGRIPPRRRPHLRMLIEEAPPEVLKGVLNEVGKYVQPGRVAKNLLAIAEALGSARRVRDRLKDA